MTMPTVDRLRELLEYEPETGKLLWRHREDRQKSWNVRFAGKEAFTSVRGNGYLGGMIDGKGYYAHRVCFALHNGYWPEFVDHINGIKTDNRAENIRNATKSQNESNKRPMVGKASAHKGVSWHKHRQKWCAQIGMEGKIRSLGHYHSEDEAKAAYDRAAAEIYGEYVYAS